ncbi:MAG: hypothetical protein GX386_08270 [Clostridiaceae bacterium]|nr:hypothetical protein [Clostridiaceae bacterium]
MPVRRFSVAVTVSLPAAPAATYTTASATTTAPATTSATAPSSPSAPATEKHNILLCTSSYYIVFLFGQ